MYWLLTTALLFFYSFPVLLGNLDPFFFINPKQKIALFKMHIILKSNFIKKSKFIEYVHAKLKDITVHTVTCMYIMY